MKKLIPVILLSALLLTACSRSTESGESSSGTSAPAVSAETTVTKAQAGTLTTTAAAGSTEQPVSGSETTVQRVSGDSRGIQTAPAADTPADVLDGSAGTAAKASVREAVITTEAADSMIVIQIPTDSEEESQNTDIIVNDDGSIILPPVSLD